MGRGLNPENISSAQVPIIGKVSCYVAESVEQSSRKLLEGGLKAVCGVAQGSNPSTQEVKRGGGVQG